MESRASWLAAAPGGLRGGWIWRISFLVTAVAFLSSGVALAQSGPVLERADIRVAQDQDTARVVEKLSISGLSGGEIEHTLTRYGQGGVRDLAVTSGGRELPVDRKQGGIIDRYTIPAGDSKSLVYEISYTYPEGVSEENRVPLMAPAAPTSGTENSVRLSLVVPRGEYLRDSFPVIASGDAGTLGAAMGNFPAYASFELGDSPGGIMTRSNIYTALAIAVILGCVAGLSIYDRASRAESPGAEVRDA